MTRSDLYDLARILTKFVRTLFDFTLSVAVHLALGLTFLAFDLALAFASLLALPFRPLAR